MDRPKRYSTDSLSSDALKMFAAHLVLALGVGRMMAAVNPDNPDGDHIPFRKMPSRARFRAISLQPETAIKPIKIAVGSERAARQHDFRGRTTYFFRQEFDACAAGVFSDFLTRSRLKIDRTPPL
jgi:hypothetical protein